MPLSEDEQRILQEIERSFYEHDPALASRVKSASLYRHAGRNCKWAAFGFLVGLVVLLFTFAANTWPGVAGFLVMLASAFVFVGNVRKSGIGDAGKRLRDRFQSSE